MSRSPRLDYPDYVLIDLDPQECSYDRIVEAALVGEGTARPNWDDRLSQDHRRRRHARVRAFRACIHVRGNTRLRRVAGAPGGRRQARTVSPCPRTVSKAAEGPRVFRYMQNAKSKTIAAPYVLRAYAGSAGGDAARNGAKCGRACDRGKFSIEMRPAGSRRRAILFGGVLTKPQRLEKPWSGWRD